ncbi:3-phosphoshikimate 1-carboxyvinyltransferase [Clostridia bacterium]|nr:3-phosphoshikimate 1-carboxyvinyltransferase [Clostridia bacterium]
MSKAKSVTLESSTIKGTVDIPPSKSLSHRALVAASLAQGTSRISNLILSEDILATIDAMRKIGAEIRLEEEGNRFVAWVKGASSNLSLGRKDNVTFDCRESGSTIRFIIPLSLHFAKEAKFTGKGKLVERPQSVYTELFDEKNIEYSYSNKRLPLTVRGKWQPGTYTLRGNVSSQFITGLLFTLPLLAEDSVLELSTELESKGYVDLTLEMLSYYGIQIENRGSFFIIPGNQTYQARNYVVEGDYSQSIFFLLAGILGGELNIEGLAEKSSQGDAVVMRLMREMEADVRIQADKSIQVKKSRPKGIAIDCNEFPDLVPALAVLLAFALGKSHLTNLGRLKIKESDRLEAVYQNLKALGADVERGEDDLTIIGKEHLSGGLVSGWNDHRMVMSMAMAVLGCEKRLTVTDPDSVSKSYPEFWQDYQMLGGKIYEWNMG